MHEDMMTDMQYKGQLIDEYQRLDRILKIAEKENSMETIAALKTEIEYIRLKLQPIELPEKKQET